MTAFNFAQGGDVHYNEGYALFPQNAFVKDKPEYGSSTTLLKPAHHWEGGNYAAVRHMSINDECHQCALREAAAGMVTGDTFLTHVIPSMALFTDFSYVIHTPLAGATFTVKLASNGLVLGTIDGSVKGDGWFQAAGLFTPATTDPVVAASVSAGVYIPSTGNDAIEFVLDAWPAVAENTDAVDPCGVYDACVTPPDFCFTSTVFYKHARAEAYCEDVCYD